MRSAEKQFDQKELVSEFITYYRAHKELLNQQAADLGLTIRHSDAQGQAQINTAFALAVFAHGEQKRKWSDDPYWTHVVRVAKTAMEYEDDKDTVHITVSAALLHDVIEDTDFNEDALEDARLGLKGVAKHVLELTDEPHSTGNRATRKALDIQRLAKATTRSKLIKLADTIDNLPSIIEHDPKFARVAVKEKDALLCGGLDPSLLEGDAPMGYRRLFMQARHTVDRGILAITPDLSAQSR